MLKAGLEVFYWRERDLELDFIAKKGGEAIAFEVSISQKKIGGAPLDRLANRCGASKAVLIGPAGVGIGEFLQSDPLSWFGGKR